MSKDVIKFLQGSAVTQAVLGGLTIYPLVANFIYVCQMPKIMKIGLQHDSKQRYCENKK